MKKVALFSVLLVALLVVAGAVMAQESAGNATVAETQVQAPEAVASEAPAAAVNVGNKICPVTGMKIAELGKDTVEYEGKAYNLCCPDCKATFLADPSKYVAKVDEELAKEKEAAPAEVK